MGVSQVTKGRQAGIPVWETLDLDVDGVPSTIVYAQLDYTFIVRIIWNLHFAILALDWEQFAGDTALTTGIHVYYNGIVMTDLSIKSNSDFHTWGYDVVAQSDEKSPKNRVISSRWTFSKSVPNGLGMWDGETFGIQINDDISALATVAKFNVAVEGWRTPE